MNSPDNDHVNHPDGGDLVYQEEWLSAYLDDELSAAQRALVEQRISDDAHVAVMFQDLQRVRSLVGSLPAWGGRLFPLPIDNRLFELATPDELHSDRPQGLTEAADVDSTDESLAETDTAMQRDGDYHDELHPGVESALSSASIEGVRVVVSEPVGTLGQDGRQSAGWPGNWLRPVALAASLLFALGLGLLFWPDRSPRSVATTTDSRIAPSPSMDKQAGPSLSDAETQPAVEAESIVAPSMHAAEGLAAPAERFSMDSSNSNDQRARGGGLGGGALSGGEVAADAEEVDSMGRNASPLAPALAMPSSDMLQEDATTPGEKKQGARNQPQSEMGQAKALPPAGVAAIPPAAELSPLQSAKADAPSSVPSNSAPLQLAHSDAWSDAEVYTGLARLSPILNLPLANSSDNLRSERKTEGSDANFAAAGNDFPIAVVSRNRTEADGSQLAALLKQNGFGLTGISQNNSSRQVPGLITFGSSESPQPSTIALFVNRQQADQILQAAAQAGEISANPVWIIAASSKDAPQQDSQKVVLLISPQ